MNIELQAITNNLTKGNIRVGSFTLTKLWIERAAELDLSATAVSVMTALLWHYNPTKKYVFPHQETIAKRIKRSVATVKRAIAELKKAGFIISTRSKNGNLYAFTQRFFDTLYGSSCTIPKYHNEPCMIEHVKEQKKNNNNVVVFSKNFKTKGAEETQAASSTAAAVSSKTYDIREIPDIIKKKHKEGKIHNLVGYWKSLRPAVKQEYWDLDAAEKKKIQRKKELKKQAALEKQRKAAEWERIKNEPLITETYTRQQAWDYCKRFADNPDMRRFLHRGICAQLIERHEFDIEDLCKG